MRKIRDVLTYLFDKNLSIREAARYSGVGRSATQYFKERFIKSGLSWPLAEGITDIELERALYPVDSKSPRATAPAIDFETIHTSLKLPGATLKILHSEWLQQTSELHHISYSQFCKLYKIFKKSLQLSMRKVDLYGDVAYVDYSGMTIGITDSHTGEVRQAQIFIGVLGASGYTFCEASMTQRSRDWIASHTRMFKFFGGVPRVVVPDNLKAAVTKADRFSPTINATYSEMCKHYGTNPFPARAGKPKDKPKAEAGVLLAQRWILFALRKRKLFSIEEANREIGILLTHLNAKEFQKIPGSRFSRWLEHERPALLPLPEKRYEFCDWGIVRAGQDYHVHVDQHFYSVPYQLKGEQFDSRLTDTALELIHEGKVIATHMRSYVAGGTTTLPEHQHPSHKAVTNWTQEQALIWAAEIGKSTEAMLLQQLLKAKGHLFGYRITGAMKSLHKQYGSKRLEEVCAYSLANKISGTDELRNILSKKLDRLMSEEKASEPEAQIEHENIRGADYYTRLLTQERKD